MTSSSASRRLDVPASPEVSDAPTGEEESPDGVSATEPDWSRERLARRWDPAGQLLAAVRRLQAIEGDDSWARAQRLRWRLAYRMWSVVTQCDIPPEAKIDGGLLLPHPTGVVIHPDAEIGPNCLLMHQVTLGSVANRDGAPVLEGHVDVGAGAKILGPVRIGANAKIGANAVVLQDVPAGATAVGIPARILEPRRSAPPKSGLYPV